MKVNYEMTIEENKELELQVDGQQPNIKKSRIRETPTLSACADSSTDAMKSRFFDTFLYFWTFFRNFFIFWHFL